ncbi:alpha/beta hydrolase [Streptomyces sudanensis]|uniref:alpha/beta hydrolase n=1 Tax=Streptomyces sudanensis TaxID=436397 RepID=UPI0020CF998C|nr:alpha/beta hydrolase [Streptomyces sudanensis]MCP9957410.1 alpha/beta hydrolase [Streptomyces sudanensis]MCQ0002043.1 alpha/beta hydrolase [Streptomyces sudanensis]
MIERKRVRAAAAVLAAALAAGVTAGCRGGDAAPDGGPSASSANSAADRPGSSPGMPALPAALTGQKPRWEPCGAPDGEREPGPAWRCATVRVPLDYREPDGETLPVALIRKEARDRSKRIGSLLFNFGGPGASGVEMLPGFAPDYEALNTRYDLVGFDPRGVGGSSAVVCRSDEEQARAEARIDPTPDTPAEEAAYLKDGSDFGAGCARRSGKLIPHVTTGNTARDLDVVRHVLGDPELHYFGISYGTQLGAAYAHLFPGRTGRTVLDAVVDPTADSEGHARHQTTGFQRALNNYFASTGEDPAEGTARVARLLERLDERPLETRSGRKLTEGLALTGIVTPLYAESGWPLLTEALREAEDGRGDALLRLADMYNNRDADGRYGTDSHSQRAISCADTDQRPTAARAKELLPEFRRLSPVFGEFLAWDTAGWCANWPVKGEPADRDVSAPGAGPILVVGTTGDPATPYEGARRMADGLGEGVGVLVTNKGEGHGAYGTSACVTRTVDDYLLRGKVPEDGTTCP